MRGVPPVRAGRSRLAGLIESGARPADPLVLPASPGEAEYRERGSRFIAVTRGVDSEQEARDFRAAERRRFHDASHHVLAARLHFGSELFDDDGEPAGTGGRPVLTAIAGSKLTNVAVVVTRYFGGTKLGTGPLSRAYGRVAREALARTARRRCVAGRRVRLRFAYEDTGAVMRALSSVGARRLDGKYAERSELAISVALNDLRALRDRLRDATADRIEIHESTESVLLPE